MALHNHQIFFALALFASFLTVDIARNENRLGRSTWASFTLGMFSCSMWTLFYFTS
jgi:hypothetical protein